jgi:hypothetical protein
MMVNKIMSVVMMVVIIVVMMVCSVSSKRIVRMVGVRVMVMM